MNDNLSLEKQREQLKDLLKKSLILSEQQKDVLMSKVEVATLENIEKTIQLLGTEADRIEYMKKLEDKILKVMQDSVAESKTNLKNVAKKIVKRIEKRVESEDVKKAEDLLK